MASVDTHWPFERLPRDRPLLHVLQIDEVVFEAVLQFTGSQPSEKSEQPGQITGCKYGFSLKPKESLSVPSTLFPLDAIRSTSISPISRMPTTMVHPPLVNTSAFVNDILRWLDAPTFQQQQQAALSDRMDGTGTWFIESNEFVQFTEAKGEILWGTGIPGSGKTILTSVSVDHLQRLFGNSPGTEVLYVYLRYNERHSYRQILGSLLSQLAVKQEAALSHLAVRYNAYGPDRKVGFMDKKDMIPALKAIVRDLPKVFVALDGVDEAHDEVKDELFQELPSIGINLLIMSRPLDIYAPFIPNALRIRVQAHPEDIRVFIEEHFRKSVRLKTIVWDNPELIQELVTQIQEKSGGMFIMAHLLINTLLSCSSPYSLREALQGLPSGIDDMYSLTLGRIAGQSAGDVSIAHRVITWLLHSQEPLSVALVQHALSFSMDKLAITQLTSFRGGPDTSEISEEHPAGGSVPPDEELLSTIAGGSLDLSHVAREPSDYQFRFIHYTTEEYMKTSVIFESLPDPHVLISVTCVVFLAAYGGEFPSHPGGFPPWYFRLQPLLGYALRHLGHHARKCQEEGTLHPCIFTYFSAYPRLLHSHDSEKDARTGRLNPRKTYYDLCRLPGLRVAVMLELTEIINERLLPLETDEEGEAYTPFHYAPSVDPNTANFDDQSTPLISAIRLENDSLDNALHALCQREDIDIELQDEQGRTAFWWACKKGKADDNPSTQSIQSPTL
ncbi:hypothetical protein NMY22_g4495 [Coprinellus aureogranulatus]|nr:hypothetical protein NMY22_g4495 [Coprinellus aureogranulatus]